jgi:hypothetical protein
MLISDFIFILNYRDNSSFFLCSRKFFSNSENYWLLSRVLFHVKICFLVFYLYCIASKNTRTLQQSFNTYIYLKSSSCVGYRKVRSVLMGFHQNFMGISYVDVAPY